MVELNQLSSHDYLTVNFIVNSIDCSCSVFNERNIQDDENNIKARNIYFLDIKHSSMIAGSDQAAPVIKNVTQKESL